MPKSQFIQIRVSEEEKREWQKLSKQHGMTLAEWIRSSCKGMAWPYVEHKPISPELPWENRVPPLRVEAAADPERIRMRLPDSVFKTTPIPKLYPKHPASRIKRGRPKGTALPKTPAQKTSERLRSMREGK